MSFYSFCELLPATSNLNWLNWTFLDGSTSMQHCALPSDWEPVFNSPSAFLTRSRRGTKRGRHARAAKALGFLIGWSAMGSNSAWSHGGGHSDPPSSGGQTVIDGLDALPLYPSASQATRGAYEVWLSDQANTRGISAATPLGSHGGQIRIYDSADLELPFWMLREIFFLMLNSQPRPTSRVCMAFCPAQTTAIWP
jgi:hypothetical protein